jgi:predicted MPP superfamily phosphohydrolase
MHLICETLWLKSEYYPIYKRKKNIKHSKKWLAYISDAFYNRSIKRWDYADNIINHDKDEIFCWYPPIVTRLYCNNITDNNWNNILVSLIKKRHANKKTS